MLTTNARPAVFSDVEGTLITISFPRVYYVQARDMGIVPRSNQIRTEFFNLLSKLFSSKSKPGGILRYLGIMAAVKNLDMSHHDSVMVRVNPLLKAALKPKPLAKIREYEAQGMSVYLVSASLHPGVVSFAAEMGWQGEGSYPVMDGNHLTGSVEKPLSGEEKAVRVRKIAAEKQIDLTTSIGFGDTMADIPFLSLLGTVYVVDPDSDLQAVAISKGWTIIES